MEKKGEKSETIKLLNGKVTNIVRETRTFAFVKNRGKSRKIYWIFIEKAKRKNAKADWVEIEQTIKLLNGKIINIVRETKNFAFVSTDDKPRKISWDVIKKAEKNIKANWIEYNGIYKSRKQYKPYKRRSNWPTAGVIRTDPTGGLVYYEGWRLVYVKDNMPVKIGDPVTLHSGERAEVEGGKVNRETGNGFVIAQGKLRMPGPFGMRWILAA